MNVDCLEELTYGKNDNSMFHSRKPWNRILELISRSYIRLTQVVLDQ